MNNKIAGIFSEPFKIHLVNEIESGRILKCEANRKYGILGHSTIAKWCKKYGKFPNSHSKGKKSMKTIINDSDLLLKNEIKALKEELSDARFKNVVLETMIDIADDTLDTNIRKKFGAKQSGK